MPQGAGKRFISIIFAEARVARGLCAAVALAMPMSVSAEIDGSGHAQTVAASDQLSGLEAFVDGVVASHMERQVAGVQVAIVKGETPLLIKGYGLAAVEPARAVDPERTLFRLASISKTFTWIALMQLAETGKLRLDDPVNQHLPPALKVPSDGWTQPIRILDLMNHTAGFEESPPLDEPRDDSEIWSLETALRSARPRRVHEPGRLSVYSNYGAELAGALVAHVSQMDFETYVEKRILQPLGMRYTTFREPYAAHAPAELPAPMPQALVQHRGDGLEWNAGAWQTQPHMRLIPFAPSGAAVSTASEMARYMIALLNPARLEDAGVLRRTSHATLTRESFRPAPGLRGIHHGFFDDPPGRHHALGYQTFGHGGNLPHFHAHLALVPALGLGVFVAVNSNPGASLTGALLEHLLWRYFPPPDRPPLDRAQEAGLEEFVGAYRFLRRPYTTLDALFKIDRVVAIERDGGCLMLSSPARRDPACFARVEGDLFQQTDGDARLAFVRDADGEIAYVLGALAGQRVGFTDTLGWLRSWLLIGFLSASAMAWDAWRRRTLSPMRAAWPRWMSRLLALAALLWLGFYAAGILWQVVHGAAAFADYPQPLLVTGLTLLVFAVSLSLVATLALPWLWRHSAWSLRRRLGYTIALLALWPLIATLYRWNVLGFHF